MALVRRGVGLKTRLVVLERLSNLLAKLRVVAKIVLAKDLARILMRTNRMTVGVAKAKVATATLSSYLHL